MTKKKLIIILVLVLAVGGFGAKKFLLPKPAEAKPKIDGTLYVLPKGFTFNLADGHYATMTVALLLAPGQSDGASAEGATTTPAGFGTLTQEPVIRAILTNDVTDDTSKQLLSSSGRDVLRKRIIKNIKTQTDVKVTAVYFTDLAVQ
jgi:flagellar basal body-associated protein FliL